MCCGMKTRKIIAKRYAARLIYPNDYLAYSPGVTLTDKISIKDLKEILLNSMPNSWSKQAYIQVFDCESITFKKAIHMFERMEISESIYKGVVEPYY